MNWKAAGLTAATFVVVPALAVGLIWLLSTYLWVAPSVAVVFFLAIMSRGIYSTWCDVLENQTYKPEGPL